MRGVLGLACTLLLLLLATAPPAVSGASAGSTCVGCTLVVSITEQLALVRNATVDKDFFDEVCHLLPKGPLRSACDLFFQLYGADIIIYLEDKATPDVVCSAISLCKNPQCHLFPAPSEGMEAAVSRLRRGRRGLGLDLDPCDIPGIKEVCELIAKIFDFANNHDPLDDTDNDMFSPFDTLRGSDWRGRDCNDKDSDVFPGRVARDADADTDSNCNGIYGKDPATGTPYETLFCEGTQPYGTVVLGDSASAHFHVPPQWLEPAGYNSSTFVNMLNSLENELDFPEVSATTAFFTNTSTEPDIQGPVNSSYLMMRSRNLCNHRNYQNLGVNGARVGSMNDTIVRSLAANQALSTPMTVFYSLIGNDVCNGHNDTLAHMTTADDYRKAVLATFEYLDTVLPSDSHMITMGLADGRVLYEALHNRTHPIGQLRNDVTYSQLYTYLNCLEISPCTGWMNTNETLRNLTTAHAQMLSGILKNISQVQKYKHFDIGYIDNPFNEAIQRWQQAGGETWQLIEPVDGFHPNQYAQPLVVSVVWDIVAKQFPNFLPPVNPHNADIIKIFGNQGGH